MIPAEWFEVIGSTYRKHNILIISLRERTLYFEREAIAGGVPLAAVTGRAEIGDSPGPDGLGGTFGGNPVACAAALEVLKAVDSHSLSERSAQIGRLFT